MWAIGSTRNGVYKYREYDIPDDVKELISEAYKLYCDALNSKSIIKTELNSNILFVDDQIELFTDEIYTCMKKNNIGDRLLNYIQDLVRKDMGCDFYPTISPFSFWILEYNKNDKIGPHVDTELTQNKGLTVVIPLYVENTRDIEYKNSKMIPGDKIAFVPHGDTIHHTVENLGKRVVLQIKGSSNPFDSPVDFFLRKVKNYAYLKWWAILPNKMITKVKEKGFVRSIITNNGVALSPTTQKHALYIINLVAFLFGHYGKYIMYYFVLLYPLKIRSHFGQLIPILEIMNAIHFFSLSSYIWIHIHYSKTFFILLLMSQILFTSGFYRIGTDLSFFKTEIFNLNPDIHWINKFPYTVTNHPQLIGIFLSYSILSIHCEGRRLYLISQIICVLIYTKLELCDLDSRYYNSGDSADRSNKYIPDM
jgi:hypothetical protein